MSQPPAETGCPIFDENGNVITDEHGRVVTRDFQKRAPVTYQKNGSLLHDYVATNFKVWQIAASWFLKLAAIVLTTYGTLEWVAAPRLREYVRAVDAPLEARIALSEAQMSKHELEISRMVPDYMTRREIDDQIKRLDAEIRELRAHVAMTANGR